MPRPKFSVQHFIACLNAIWEGIPGPYTPRTLESVSYVYSVPPDSEFPVKFTELWLYTRLFLLNNRYGDCEFIIKTIWLDAPGSKRLVRRDKLTSVSFRASHPVVNITWVLRPVEFPGIGRYEFRLYGRTGNSSGEHYQRIAREFIKIERRP